MPLTTVQRRLQQVLAKTFAQDGVQGGVDAGHGFEQGLGQGANCVTGVGHGAAARGVSQLALGDGFARAGPGRGGQAPARALEFAHVARPVVGLQMLEGCGVETLRSPWA